MYMYKYIVFIEFLLCFYFADSSNNKQNTAGRLFGVQLSDPQAPIGPAVARYISNDDTLAQHVHGAKHSHHDVKEETISAAIQDTTEPQPVEYVLKATATQFVPLCPMKFDLIDGQCVRIIYKDAVMSCPYGTYRGRSQQCTQVDAVPPEFICPALFEPFIKGCIRRHSVPPQLLCPSDFSKIDNFCSRPERLRSELYCPDDYNMTHSSSQVSPSSDDIVCVKNVEVQAQVSCSFQSFPLTDALLKSVKSALPTPQSQGNFEFKIKQIKGGPVCVGETNTDPRFKCPQGYVLKKRDKKEYRSDDSKNDKEGDLLPLNLKTATALRRMSSNDSVIHKPSDQPPENTTNFSAKSRKLNNSQTLKKSRQSENSNLKSTNIKDNSSSSSTVLQSNNTINTTGQNSTDTISRMDDDNNQKANTTNESHTDNDIILQPEYVCQLLSSVPLLDDNYETLSNEANRSLTEKCTEGKDCGTETDESIATKPEPICPIGYELACSNLHWIDLDQNQKRQLKELTENKKNLVCSEFTCRTIHVSQGTWECPKKNTWKLLHHTEGAICQSFQQLAPLSRCPIKSQIPDSKGWCEAMMVQPMTKRCPDGYHLGMQQATGKLHRLPRHKEVTWGTPLETAPVPDICEWIEYADVQQLCPKGYELVGSIQKNSKVCVATKVVPPTFVCEPGYFPAPRRNGIADQCAMTVEAAPTLVSPAALKSERNAGPGEVSVCSFAKNNALSCLQQRRFYGDITDKGLKFGEKALHKPSIPITALYR